MKRKTLLLVLILVTLPSYVYAELTLEQLARQCEGVEPKPSQPAMGVLMCMSYIGGAFDQIILTDGLAVRSGEQEKRTICGPEKGKLEQLSAMVIVSAKERPETRKQSARAVLRGLVNRAFKCE